MSLEVKSNAIDKFSEQQVQLLKDMFKLNEAELVLFEHVCAKTGLDPFRNQIYAIKRKDKITIQTGIDGFRLIAERTGKYSPGKEPTYSYDQQGKLLSATAYVKKMTQDGSWHDVSASAFYEEYVQKFNGKPSQFWSQMPHNQLAKCAEALALRKAFPANFSGLYTTEEMAQADNLKADDSIQVMDVKKQEEFEINDIALQEYLVSNWSEHVHEFKDFLDEIKSKKQWTYRKCIETFNLNQKYTQATFKKWLEDRLVSK